MGMALVVAMTVAAPAAGASAHEFEFSEIGEITGRALTAQKFEPESGGSAVECNSATPRGVVSASKTEEITIEVDYEACDAFGIGPVAVSRAEYTLNANGWVAVDKTIMIDVPLVGCEISIEPTSNGHLEALSYTPVSKGLRVDAEVAGITDTVRGGSGLCGGPGELTTGTFAGELELEIL